jgi:hypothetical protein
MHLTGVYALPIKNQPVLRCEERSNKNTVENMWVQYRLVEGRLVVLAIRGGTAPL